MKSYALYTPFSALIVLGMITSSRFTSAFFTPEMFLGSLLIVGFAFLQLQVGWTLKVENLGWGFTFFSTLNGVFALAPMLIIRVVSGADLILEILEVYYWVISMALIFVLIPLFLMNHQQ